MAWTENYLCDVCGRSKTENQHDWWLGSIEAVTPTPYAPEQPVLKLTPWNEFLSHSADVKHLCGARCAQTEIDRWMTSFLENMHS